LPAPQLAQRSSSAAPQLPQKRLPARFSVPQAEQVMSGAPYFGRCADSTLRLEAWQASFNLAAAASPYATHACVDTWLTDFRGDLPKFDVPTLVVHGTEDRILPFAATAARLPELIDDVRLVAVDGGPHNVGWTHPDEVNRALMDFIGG
jgi:pimeloyl-ACP methyl ester carboxylesterase